MLCCIWFWIGFLFKCKEYKQVQVLYFQCTRLCKNPTIYSRNKWENVKNKLRLLRNSHGPNEDGDGENLQVWGCMVKHEWHV
jgi:hypothetical protein